MKENKVSCASRIREALNLRGMKQVELVEKTGLGKSAISQYCSGRYIPKQNATYLIAKALDVSEAWLMGYDVPIDRVESIKTTVTREEKDILDLVSKLDAEDKQNLKNYINGVLLAASKYDVKKESSERKAI